MREDSELAEGPGNILVIPVYPMDKTVTTEKILDVRSLDRIENHFSTGRGPKSRGWSQCGAERHLIFYFFVSSRLRM